MIRKIHKKGAEPDPLRSLFAAKVHGKLDVREAAARLPEEIEEPLDMDGREVDAEELQGLDAETVAEEAIA